MLVLLRSGEAALKGKKAQRGGYTCCVPSCYNNTKKDRELSFHKFPREKVLRNVWINAIKRKDFVPTEHHRVCSQHFGGGKKKGPTDIPSIFPLIATPKQRKEPKVRGSLLPPAKRMRSDDFETSKPIADSLVEEVSSFRQVVSKLDSEKTLLSIEVQKLKFCLQRFAGSDADIRFYTGFPNYKTLISFYNFLLPAATQLNYWGSENAENRDAKRGPQRQVQPIDELFMLLYRLRCDPLEKDIADRFGISQTTVSRTLITWINILYHTLKQLQIWSSSKVVQETMPTCFKGLIGIAPNSFVSFISDMYGGHVSDKRITESCGIVNLLEPGDMVMADRGFDIQHILASKNVTLNIPPFMRGKQQLSLEEEVETRAIASVRIHVERAIERIKNYRILQGIIPNTLHSQIDQVWFICSILTNFLPPLVY